MAEVGSGTMTPVAAGAPIGTSLAQPIPYTLLSLGRYAQIMGIAPMHFWSGATPGLDPQVFPVTGCDSIWWKYDWQDADKVSRSQLVEAIYTAEQEIATQLGTYPAPMWIEDELHSYSRPYLRGYYGSGVEIRGGLKSVRTTYGNVIEPGWRSATLLGTATTVGLTLVYTDEDGDGFYETATVTMASAHTHACYHKLYFAGHNGEQDWEVRPLRSVSLAGGIITIVLDSWLLIDPDLYEYYPSTDGVSAIDISDTTKFVASVDVYYETTQNTDPTATFYWEPYPCATCGSTGSGCEACTASTQTGCIHVRDFANGLLVPTPATYDATAGTWGTSTWDGCREPDLVKVSYRAGLIDQRYTKGYTCDPLSIELARAIAYMATARLERQFCNCGNVIALSEWLRTDLTETQGDLNRFPPGYVNESPFGTRRGEVYAWRVISKNMPDGRRLGVAVI